MTNTTRMPAIFWAHGNPMLTLSDNPYTQAYRALAARLPKPRAILVVSAHWVTTGVHVTTSAQPVTLHDFGGFPPILYDITYGAPGAPALAADVAERLGGRGDGRRGLDHGAWTILRHMYPAADLPVIQVSLDARLSGEGHWALGERLRPLRAEGILIIGSGNVVHNLSLYQETRNAFPWAQTFVDTLRTHLTHGAHAPLLHPQTLTAQGALAAPTPEHYWPLLYVLGARHEDEPLSFPVDGFEGGSISMLSVLAGAP